MKEAFEIETNEQLAFFGKINASISHELKNVLAIIGEASGLLGDLIDLAENGKAPDMTLFKSCSQDIEEEIQRGFATSRAMNTFSHSVDQPIAEVPLAELISLMISISSYLSYACKVKISPSDLADLKITTCPFRLQELIYQALVFSYKLSSPEGEVAVSIQAEADGRVGISFSNSGAREPVAFPVEEMGPLAESIQAKIRIADNCQSVDIIVPQAIM